MIHVISLGAGVQSSTMALMAAHGEITPMPDCAIFADTQAEPKWVYEWLDWLDTKLPFPVHRVSAGNIAENALARRTLSGHEFQDIPWRTGGNGLGKRQCTSNYKLLPIYKKIRDLGATHKNPATVWVGISVDESHRAKPARPKYIRNTFPLLDKHVYRLDCLTWMQKQGYPLPKKSACVFCPYHGNDEWRDVRDNDPEGWALAVKVDDAIRANGMQQYAHRDLVPLMDADLTKSTQTDLWGEECEGMCGV
jgi:hypothetical protein